MKNIRFYLNLDENKKNSTKYGEFVCSCYKWLPLDKQKENAKHFEEITKI